MLEHLNRLSLQNEGPPWPSPPSTGSPSRTFYDHSRGERVNTDAVLIRSIRQAHRGAEVTAVPQLGTDLLVYATATGNATYQPIVDPGDPDTKPWKWNSYVPPASRLGGGQGAILTEMKYGKYAYKHDSREYILYIVECRDGTSSYPDFRNQYIIHDNTVKAQSEVNKLILDCGMWFNTLHEEIWVFDGGFWQKESDLFNSIAKSRWEDVILDSDEKSALRGDVKKFFDARQRYERYRIAWKRGIIYYGPPGNGKTVSIKALSNELYNRTPSIPTLYVRSLSSFAGPEYSVKQIFAKARAEAPCLLVFEDLDSLVTDAVRSYFLNEVDGLNSNTGIYMIGSTNHIDRLDPGISKRPSRFDRKFEFPKPNMEERIKYCEYWRHKLGADQDDDNGNKDDDDDDDDDDLVHLNTDDIKIDFPKELSPEIARITDDFSFAYIQEAFVATLLVIAGSEDDDDHYDDDTGGSRGSKGKDKFDHLLFWRVIKKQVELLREQI